MTLSDLTCYACSYDLALYNEKGEVVRLSDLGECDWNRIKDREVYSIQSGWEYDKDVHSIGAESYILVTLKNRLAELTQTFLPENERGGAE